MFHSWSLEVDAADISPAMITRARDHFGNPDGLSWTVRGFDQPVPSPGSYDAAVCVGNSLALASDLATAGRAVAELLRAVRVGGVVVVHVLNLWRLQEGPCVWQKCKRVELPQGDVLIHKGVHRCGASGYVDLLVSTQDDPPVLRTESVHFLGLELEQLADFANLAGARKLRFFGGYQGQPYDRRESVDLVMVAER
jgi:SAM-dependent methyltransferase